MSLGRGAIDQRAGAFVTRFAPSPTGRLHLGHAYSALCAFEAAREVGGVCLLRIEDIDQTRCRPMFETAIYEDLSWLGLDWPDSVRRQSEHVAAYDAVVGDLARRGLAYRCFKTRRDIEADIANAPHGSPTAYVRSTTPVGEDEAEARAAKGERFAWRFDAQRARDVLGDIAFMEEDLIGRPLGEVPVDPLRLGDAVLARKDALASYHIACCHDDALQGVTHVIRGEDLRESVHLHVCLQRLLDWPTPVYRHHRLVLGSDGKRLAKRDFSETLSALRGSGETPESLKERLQNATYGAG